MNKKASLNLMEQLIMVLVFALCAAICLQCFILSDHLSKEQGVKAHSALIVQNAAEVLKSSSGDLSKATKIMGGYMEGYVWQIPYSESWEIVADGEAATYIMQAQILEDNDVFLGTANIALLHHGETVLSASVSWQKGVLP